MFREMTVNSHCPPFRILKQKLVIPWKVEEVAKILLYSLCHYKWCNYTGKSLIEPNMMSGECGFFFFFNQAKHGEWGCVSATEQLLYMWKALRLIPGKEKQEKVVISMILLDIYQDKWNFFHLVTKSVCECSQLYLVLC